MRLSNVLPSAVGRLVLPFAALLCSVLPLRAIASQLDLNGPAGSESFGNEVVVLPNGNIVVTDPNFDVPGFVDVGAVHLYTPDGTLISTLTGSAAGDQVGIGGAEGKAITVLPNGDFVVQSIYWANAGVIQAGAVTWVDGETGLNGVVTTANSLVGSTAGDNVGRFVKALADSDYVVYQSSWDNVAESATDAGAVTWCDGDGSPTGAVDASNSLVGGHTEDLLGDATNDVVALSNGHYVVRSRHWDNDAVINAGAVTWADGGGGTVGLLSASTSLVGSTANDLVGGFGIVPLSNGHYVVVSRLWDNGGVSEAGAVTWGNGNGGTVGPIDSSNSLVGSSSNDRIGGGSVGLSIDVNDVLALSNGNYLVGSPDWRNGALGVDSAGAVTFGNGASGVAGEIDEDNSLVGVTLADRIGNRGIVAVGDGNAVVLSANWDNGATADVGAATWIDGSAGRVGTIDVGNSLIGSSAFDRVGNKLTALGNGDYVVVSSSWDNAGTAIDVGAVTWADGNSGIVGEVSTGNSLVGEKQDDRIGAGDVVALSNGHYVVGSPEWGNGVDTFVGAVTWRDGSSAQPGVVSAANSLIGAFADDEVGTSILALSNGNYLISVESADLGADADVGAVAWGDGASGTVGVLGLDTALFGSKANDGLGNGEPAVLALSSGHYVVPCSYCDVDGIPNAGAVVWGNGEGGLVGRAGEAVSALVGRFPGDSNEVDPLIELGDGSYAFRSAAFNSVNGLSEDVGAVTLALGDGSTTGLIGPLNSVLGGLAFNGDSLLFDYDAVNKQLVVARPNESNGIVSLFKTPVGVTMDVAAAAVDIAEDDLCSLREAIRNANADAQVDNDDCPAGDGSDTLLLNGSDYVFSDADPDDSTNALPVISSDITINGFGSSRILRDEVLTCDLDGSHELGEFRLFRVTNEGRLSLREVTLRNGCADGSGPANDGGAIRVEGSGQLSLFETRVEANSARDKSGGIDTSGSAVVSIIDSTIEANLASGGGGGIGHGSSGLFTIEGSLIYQNSADGAGGGGIGTFADTTMRIRNSTISDNQVLGGPGGGGGIGNQGDMELLHLSFVNNVNFGDLGGDQIGNTGTLHLKNSLIHSGSDALSYCVDLSSGVTASGNNVSNRADCANLDDAIDLVTSVGVKVNPEDNGGITPTHALVPASPAIDAASDCTDFDGAAVDIDQRDFERPDGDIGSGGQCDIGAFEFGPGDEVAQTISFGSNPGPFTFGGSAGAVSATASSGLTVSYSTTTTSVCTVDAGSGAISIVGAGDCIVRADQAGNRFYLAATQATQTVVINQASQTIGFGTNPGPLTFGGSSGSANATASSGLPVSYGTTTAAICTVHSSSGAITILAAGDCVVTADQAGNSNYSAAAQVTQTVLIDQASQTISFGSNPGPLTFGGSSSSVSATASSGLTVSYGTTTAAICTVNSSSGAITIVAAGECVVTADQAGNSNYSAAAQVTQIVVIDQASQTIGFGSNPGPLTFDGSSGSVSATASSGLTVGYGTITSAICTVHSSSGAITIVAAGDCVVTADQAGNTNYLAATQATQTVVIDQAAQNIDFPAQADRSLADGAFTLSASGGDSGNPVQFSSLTTAVCSTVGSNGTTLTPLTAGTCSVRANQLGNDNYLAATAVERSFEIAAGAAPPSIAAQATIDLLEDHSAPLAITVADAEIDAADLQLGVSSSNQTLFTDAALTAALGGSGGDRSLQLTPLADAFGSATLTLTVSNGSLTDSIEVLVTVTPVNDAPTASYAGDRVHAGGSSGSQSVPGFAASISAGPANETSQQVAFDVTVLHDSTGVLAGVPSLSANGQLSYVLSGNDGVARLRVQAVDDGGISNGGSDRDAAHELRIIVGSGAVLSMSIERMLPVGKLAAAQAKGLSLVEYRITARNDGDLPLTGLQLYSNAPAALQDLLWSCEVDTGNCQPGNGSGAIYTVFDLPAGQQAEVRLTARLDSEQAFVELIVTAVVSTSDTLLGGSQLRSVLVEPASASAVFRAGFE